MASKKTAKIILILIFAFLFCTAATWADIEKEVNRDFDVKPGGTLLIDSDRGSIEIQTSESDKVEVRILLTARTSRESRAEEIFEDFSLDFEQDGDNIKIQGDYSRNSGWFSSNNNKLRVEFLVRIPEKFNVDLETGGGSIYVDNLEGTVRANTSGGSMKFNHIKGPVDARTSGGSISLKSCEGMADVRTSGGSIDIGQVDGEVLAKTSGGSISVDEVKGSIDASTSGGSVRAQISDQPGADCRLSTSGGSVTVSLARDVAVDIDARTSAGRVESDFKVEMHGRYSRSSLRGKINGGGPQLYLRTSAGNIYVNEI